jgi:hypothetical protein
MRKKFAIVSKELPRNAPAILTYPGLTSCKVNASRVEVAYKAVRIGNVDGGWEYIQRVELGAITPPHDTDSGLNYFVNECDERGHISQVPLRRDEAKASKTSDPTINRVFAFPFRLLFLHDTSHFLNTPWASGSA